MRCHALSAAAGVAQRPIKAQHGSTLRAATAPLRRTAPAFRRPAAGVRMSAGAAGQPATATKPAPAAQSAGGKSGDADGSSAATKVVLDTIEYRGQKAYYAAPKDPAAARGVVLFLHGFSQSPKAYALLYQQLAAANLLVVAPNPQPMFSLSPEVLQGAIVDSAAFWHQLLHDNAFPPVRLASGAAARNAGLLGHSVGAGVATHVAKEAAKAGRPFQAVMYMAPQTQVVDQYLPAAAVADWPVGSKGATTFALQYGLADLIAPFVLARELKEELAKINTVTPVTSYLLGTHVGFEDQLFIGELDVDEQLLPDASVVLLLLTAAIALGVRGVNLLPAIRFLLRRAKREERDAGQQQQGAKGGLRAGAAANTATAMPLMGAKEILDMPSRGAAPVAAAGAGSNGGLLQQQQQPSAGAGLSAGEKALLLLQMALDDEEAFEAHQQPLRASDKPVQGTEEVSILPPDEAWFRYFSLLLLPTGGLFAATSLAARLTDGGWHWLFAALSLLSGVLAAGGAVALGVQVYVDRFQRPPARERAAQYFKQVLADKAL